MLRRGFLKRVLTALFLIICLYLLLKNLSVNTSASPYGCQVPEEITNRLRILTLNVHKTLTNLNITHFLCYGSLWGALRNGFNLPWEGNVEFCVANQDALYLDESYLLRMFRRSGLDLEYDWGEGVYTVFDNSKDQGYVNIFVFEKDSVTGMMRRIGWKRRLLPPDCETSPTLHCFPPRLIEPPLPYSEFEQMQIPVPREEIEIQKYLFQDSWWKEEKPQGC